MRDVRFVPVLSAKVHGWKRTRASIHGTHRAEFWRKLGYPNLQKAWETNRRKHAQAQAAKQSVATDKVSTDTIAADLAAMRRIKGG